MATYGNGLNGSRDVYRTADLASNEFLRRGDPIESPLEIISPDGTQSASLSVANGTGNLTVLTDGSIVLDPNSQATVVVGDGVSGTGLVVKPGNETTGAGVINIQNGATSTVPTRYSVYDASVTGGGLTNGNLQVFGYSGAGYGTIRQILNANPTGSAIGLGDATAVGGAVVNVNGTLGAGRVYDTVYNIPPAPTIFSEIATWTTDMTSGQNLSTFTIPATGLYMIYLYIDLSSATLASNDVQNFFSNFLLYGDPAHSALLVPLTNNQIASFAMARAPSTNFGYVSSSIIMNLANNTYEPNQRFKWAKTQNGGYTGGTVTMKLYKLF